MELAAEIMSGWPHINLFRLPWEVLLYHTFYSLTLAETIIVSGLIYIMINSA